MPWCFLDFCLLLLLSPGFPQGASILLEVQWLKLDATPCETSLVAALYGTKVPSHVLQYATFIKYLGFFYLGEGNSAKGHQGGWGLEHLPSEERLGDQGCLQKRQLWVLKLKEERH